MRSFGSILALAGLLAGCSSDQNRTQLHSVLRMEHVPPQALPTNAIVSEEISTNGLYGAAAGACPSKGVRGSPPDGEGGGTKPALPLGILMWRSVVLRSVSLLVSRLP